MTHARMPNTRPGLRAGHRQTGGSEPEPDDLTCLRGYAETIELPATCPHRPCRGGRCRGPRGTTQACPEAVLPDCLAGFFEVHHAPVRAWQAYWDALSEQLRRAKEGLAALEQRMKEGR